MINSFGDSETELIISEISAKSDSDWMKFTNVSENTINLKKYWEELKSNINFEQTNLNNKDNSYIIIKQDLKSKENTYEIINPTSKKEFDELFNKLTQNENKENNLNNSNNKEISKNNEKKKSKFNNQNPSQSNKNNNISINSFYPLLIFKYSELKSVVEQNSRVLQLFKKIYSRKE